MRARGIFVALGLIALVGQCVTIARAQSGFRVTDQVLARDFAGFGAEMNPYLYCTPNYGEMITRAPFAVGNNPYRHGLNGFGDVTEENLADYERKVVELRPQHVRVFVLLDWWSLQGDWEIAKGDPRMVESLVRTVRLAQRAGASVNLTLWYGKYFKAEPEETGKQFGRIVAELIEERGLNAIRYLTIQNEVNGDGEHGAMRLTLDQYHRLYRALGAELSRRGVRDRIKIISGDLLYQNQVRWLTDLGYYLSDVSDGYSIHVYWDYWDTPKLRWRLADIPPIVASLPERVRRPMYVTEFGVRGFRKDDKVEPGYFWDDREIADTKVQAMENAWFMIEALNKGFVATVQWDLADVWYDRRMHYGVIGEPGNGWGLKPGYWMLKLFTQTTRPGWETMKVEGAATDQSVAAMRSNWGEKTIFVMNRSEEVRGFSIRGVAGKTSFRRLVWNGDGSARIVKSATTDSSSSGMLMGQLPPMSVTAFTTMAGRLESGAHEMD